MPRFAGKVAFITGASSGIGAALASEFAAAGAAVALAARRVDRLDSLARELAGRGHRALALACDVTHDGDLDRAMAATREALGRVDVIVANAGFGVVGPLERLTLDDYRRQFETNVFGALRTVYAGLAELRRTCGVLVLIGSVNSYLSFGGVSPYAMSKFALRALADALRYELARDGVGVTLICPGFVESEIHQVDNLGTRHPAARSPAPAWLRMPAPQAARQIVRAVGRRRPEVVITGHGKLAVLAQRHAPRALAAVVRAFSISGRREAGVS